MAALEEIGNKLVLQGKDAYLSGIKQVDSAHDGMGKHMDTAGKSTSSLTTKSLALATALGTALYNAAMAAGRAVVGFAKDTISEASDLNETVSKVGVVFADQGDIVNQWGKTAAAAMGMSTNEALTAAGTYGNLFRSMGMTSDTSADMSKGLVQLGADLASFNNMDPTEVLDKLRAGLTGESEPLKSLGININQATIEAKAMSMGLIKNKKELDANAKAQAVYALMMEQTSLAQGDFARTSSGLANQQRIMDANMKNLKATIGTALLPIVNKLMIAMNALFANPKVQAAIQGIIGFIDKLGWAIGNIWDDIALGASPIDAIADTFDGMIPPEVFDALDAVYNWFANTLTVISGIAQTVLGAISVFWAENGASIIATVQNLWGMVQPMFQAGITFIQTLVSFVLNNISLFWSTHGAQVMAIVNSLWNAVQLIFSTAVGIITGIFTIFTDILRGDWGKLGTDLMALWTTALNGIKSIIDSLWPGIQAVFELGVAAVKGIFENVDWPAVGKAILDGIWTGIQSGWQWLKDMVSDVAGSLFSAAKKALGIGSPSKKFEFIGRMANEGFAKGAQSTSGLPAQAIAQSMGATLAIPSALVRSMLAPQSSSVTNNYSREYNLGVTTSQSPQVVQRSFAMMELLA